MYQLFQINKIVLFVFLFVFLGALDLTAQNRQLDSLEHLLKVHAEKDSARLDLLLKICWIYTTTDYKKIANHLEEISSLRMSLPKNKLYPRVDIIYGYYYKSIGEFGKSYQSFEDALEYYEGARDTLNMIRSLYRLGELSNNTHNLVRSFSSRRAYYDQASELLKYFRNDEQSIFINNGLATLLANEGKFGEALLSLQKSKLIYDTIQFREKPRSMGFYYYQLGRCYFNVKNYSECIKYLAKAENIANELNNKDLKVEVNDYLADYYVTIKDNQKAESYFLKNVALQKDYGAQNLGTSIRSLLSFYLKTDNTQGIMRYLPEYMTLQDTIIQDIRADKYAEYEAKFEMKEKDLRNQLLMKELEGANRRNLYKNIIVLGFLIMGLVISWLYYKLYKLNKQLEEQNEQKERLIAVLGHDIRNPLINLLNRAQRMSTSDNKATLAMYRENMAKIMQLGLSAFKISENIHSYITTSRDIDGNLINNFNLVHELLLVIEQYEPVAQIRNVNIVQHFATHDEHIVKTDRYAFQTLIRNLIDNAVKYTTENSNIDVYIYSKNDKTSETEVRISNPIDLKSIKQTKLSKSGFGWTIMNDILKKYNIVHQVNNDGKTYEVFLTLPNDNN